MFWDPLALPSVCFSSELHLLDGRAICSPLTPADNTPHMIVYAADFINMSAISPLVFVVLCVKSKNKGVNRKLCLRCVRACVRARVFFLFATIVHKQIMNPASWL